MKKMKKLFCAALAAAMLMATMSGCGSSQNRLEEILESGKLELDSDKLKKALTDNPSAVKDLVVGDGKTTGITTTMATHLTDWLSSKGIFQAAKEGVSKTLNKLTDQYNAVSERIDARVAQYKAQFTQLDVLMTSLNNTSSYLTQQFENTSSNK